LDDDMKKKLNSVSRLFLNPQYIDKLLLTQVIAISK
jgi:hypothetical protein